MKDKILDKIKNFICKNKYSLIILCVFMIVLLAYWPGILVSDSVFQWDQAQTGNITNWHPAYNTYYIMILSKIWNNPGLILAIQCIVLSFSIGGFFNRLEKYYGVNKKYLLICSFIIAIIPLNFNAAVILLKDTIYSALLLILVNITIDIINNKDYFENIKNGFIFGFVLLAIMLSRHNGIVTVALYSIFLMFFYKKKKILYIASISSIIIYFLMTTVGFSILNIKEDNYANKYAPISHIYARILNEKPSLLSEKEMETLSEYVDIDKLKETYHPNNMDYSIGAQKMSAIRENGKKYLSLAIGTFFKDPLIFVEHYLCLDAYLYNPFPFYNSDYVGMFIETDLWKFKDVYPNLNENSKISFLLPILKKVSLKYQEGNIGQITMRPPLYLYLSFIITILIAKYKKYKKLFFIGIISLFNTIGLAIAMPVPMVRYVYPTILIGQLVIVFGIYELYDYIKKRKCK